MREGEKKIIYIYASVSVILFIIYRLTVMAAYAYTVSWLIVLYIFSKIEHGHVLMMTKIKFDFSFFKATALQGSD